MKIGIDIHIKGVIDVPDSWEDPNDPKKVLDIADYRYTEQLTADDTVAELTRKLYANSDSVDATFQFSREY